MEAYSNLLLRILLGFLRLSRDFLSLFLSFFLLLLFRFLALDLYSKCSVDIAVLTRATGANLQLDRFLPLHYQALSSLSLILWSRNQKEQLIVVYHVSPHLSRP